MNNLTKAWKLSVLINCLWHFCFLSVAGSMPTDYELYYGFTRFAIELNELCPELKDVLPRTDARFRPDQRYSIRPSATSMLLPPNVKKIATDFPQTRLHRQSLCWYRFDECRLNIWACVIAEIVCPSDLVFVFTEKWCLGHTGTWRRGTWRWHPQRSSVLRTCREPEESGKRRTTPNRSHASLSKHRYQ